MKKLLWIALIFPLAAHAQTPGACCFDSTAAPPLASATINVGTPGTAIPADFFGTSEPQTNIDPWVNSASPTSGPPGANNIFMTLYGQLARQLKQPIYFRMEGDYQNPTLWDCNNVPQLYAPKWPDGTNGSGSSCSGISTAALNSAGSSTAWTTGDQVLVLQGTTYLPSTSYASGAIVNWNGGNYQSQTSSNVGHQPDTDLASAGGHWTSIGGGGGLSITASSGSVASVTAAGGQLLGLGYATSNTNVPTMPLTVANAVATSSGGSVSTNVLTIPVTNTLSVGNTVTMFGCPTSIFLNGRTLTVASATGSQFTANLTYPNVGSIEACSMIVGTTPTINVTAVSGATLNYPQSATLQTVYELWNMHNSGVPSGCSGGACTIPTNSTPYIQFSLGLPMADSMTCNNVAVTPTTPAVPCYVDTEAANWQTKFGSNFSSMFKGFELGNEPDNYPGQGYRPSSGWNGGTANSTTAAGWLADFAAEEANIFSVTGTHFAYLDPATAGNNYRAAIDASMGTTPWSYISSYSQHQYPYGKQNFCTQVAPSAVSADAGGIEYLTFASPLTVGQTIAITGATSVNTANSDGSYTVTATVGSSDFTKIVGGGKVAVTMTAGGDAAFNTASSYIWKTTSASNTFTYTVPSYPGAASSGGGTFIEKNVYINVSGMGLGSSGTRFDAEAFPQGGIAGSGGAGVNTSFLTDSCTGQTCTLSLLSSVTTLPAAVYVGATMYIQAGNHLGTGLYKVTYVGGGSGAYYFQYQIPYSGTDSSSSGVYANAAYSINYNDLSDTLATVVDSTHLQFARNLPIADTAASIPSSAFVALVSGSSTAGGSKPPNTGPTCNPSNILLEPSAAWKTVTLNGSEADSLHTNYPSLKFRIGEHNFMSPSQQGVTNAPQMSLGMIDEVMNYAEWCGPFAGHACFDGFNWFEAASTAYNFADYKRFNSGATVTYNITSASSCATCGVHSAYYGMYLLATMVQAGAQVLQVNPITKANVSIHATLTADNHVHVAILNKDLTQSGTVSLTIPSHTTATAYTLSGQGYNAWQVLTGAAVGAGGSGCTVGDILQVNQTGTSSQTAQVQILTVSGSAAATVGIVSGHQGYGYSPSATAAPTTPITGSCSGTTITVQAVASGMQYAGQTWDASIDGTLVGSQSTASLTGAGGVFVVPSVAPVSAVMLDVAP